MSDYSRPILIVDDSDLALAMASDLLSEMGYRSMTTSSSLDVLDLIRDNAIEIVLLDMKMPEKDGLTVLSEIKDLEKDLGRGVQVFIVTGTQDQMAALEALKKGAFCYITKPLQPKTLGFNIQNALNHLAENDQSDLLPPPGMPEPRPHPAGADHASVQDAGESLIGEPLALGTYQRPVLLVNRHAADLEEWAGLLQMGGYRTLGCPFPEKASAMCDDNGIDVVMFQLDDASPGSLTHLHSLRDWALSERRRLTILAVAYREAESAETTLLEAGASFIFGTPLNVSRLQECLEWATRRAMDY